MYLHVFEEDSLEKNIRQDPILGSQSIFRDVAHNASHPRRLDPTMELIKYSFVLYLQHGRHDIKCKPSIRYSHFIMVESQTTTCMTNSDET